MSQTVGLYIHIPFCSKKCAYCDFYSLDTCTESNWDVYLKAMCHHFKETAGSLVRQVVDTVYIGGGTPSLMGAKRLRALLETVAKQCQLSSNAEITLEGNPESLQDVSMLKKLRRCGVNRLSIGAQSFDDDMLALLGRAHDAQTAINAVNAARTAGFSNLGIDLLFGLPGQTADHWEKTLKAGLELAPEHISCYGLTVEKGTPLYEARDVFNFPDDDAQADMYLYTAEALRGAGYLHYEISNYALPGYLCRHNMKYWTLEPYIGLGPAAHSDFGGRRWSYPRSLDAYITGVNTGDTLADYMEELPMRDRAGEYLMLGLRTSRGVSGNHYARTFQVGFDAVERRLEAQQARGNAIREGDRWRLTEQGFLLSNRVIGEVLDAL